MTLPFVSYGGSSIVANFVLLALLLIVSDSARRGAPRRGRPGRLVNRQIVQLYTLIAVLFGVLVFAYVLAGRVWGQEGLEDNTANRRPILEDLRIPRGDILAERRHRARAQQPERQRRAEDLHAHVPGGQPVRARDRLLVHRPSDVGLEQSRNDELTGEKNEFVTLFEELVGHDRARATTSTRTSTPRRSSVAIGRRSAANPGAVVALEPATGKVRVMVSVARPSTRTTWETSSRELNQAEGAPIVNRATQSRYPPGSTMKVVTAAAALDSGEYTPDSIVSGESPEDDRRARRSRTAARSGSGDYGPLTLTRR